MASGSSGTARFVAPRKQLRPREESSDDSDDNYEDCSSDSSDWDTDSDDYDIPDPDELMAMPNYGPGFDLRRIRKLIKGGMCFKCYKYGPFFTCEKCGKNFHRKCAFGDPDPIFDKSLDEAGVSDYGEVELLKCSICVASEETQVKTMAKYSKKELNNAVSVIAKYMVHMYGDILKDPKLATGNAAHITLEKILEKTSNEEYLTVEGFNNDYKMIEFNLIRKFAVQSEAGDVAATVMKTADGIIDVAIACLNCAVKSFDENGKLHDSKKYGRGPIREPCPIPHIVIWVKENGYLNWPAKVLEIRPYKKEIMVQYFGERPGVKLLPFPGDKNVCFKSYSSEFPERKPNLKSDGVSKWKCAMTECRGYLNKMRAKYGEDGVVIPAEAGIFSGNLDDNIKQMFPKYVENEELAEAPADQLESASPQTDMDSDTDADDDLAVENEELDGSLDVGLEPLEIETDDDLLEQADDHQDAFMEQVDEE